MDAYGDRVYNTSLGILQNTGDAEDITQEVFITVFQGIHAFRGECSLSTWIYRIAVSHSLDFIKRRKRVKRGGMLRRVFKNREEGSMPDLPDFVHPGVMAERQEEARILFKAIEQLPENQRVAFSLHKIEGLSYQEVGDAMKTSLSAVESLMHRAKQNLRKWLEDYYNE